MQDGPYGPGSDWLKAELEDGLDEDYELELGDVALSEELPERRFNPDYERHELAPALFVPRVYG